jgi:type 1 glutamine amidotransferase
MAFIVTALISRTATADAAPKRLLIIGQGPDGHPPTTHEYVAGAKVLAELLKRFKNVQVTVAKADEPWTEGPGLIDKSDGVVLFVTQGARWMQSSLERYSSLKRLAARGGGIVAIHWSVGAIDAQYIQGQLDLLGGTRGGPQRKYREMDVDLNPVAPSHPILRGINEIKAFDEMYYALDRVPGIQPLLTQNIDGKDEMIAWCWERPDGGRSFAFVGLHFHANWQIPAYRRFVLQGVLWCLKLPVPCSGVKVDIDSKDFDLNGALPPLPSTSTGGK